ncbi:hypothetical protein GCM10009133_21430 [Cocleimonas flava]|jgi:hypothetical protein|uniref:Uncharacterized protein n=1 Tax=Cocleimonas flava TaxID=634765 RepID=A0A4R1ESL9_9GAMM|nr:hypothetical protein [Cocleimonas flava]TCJ82679.1 hypothetical protein EV695_3411 [Cocleimonas flava]
MNTKAIIASTLFTALLAGQSAFAGQDNDQGVFATDTAVTESASTDKVNYDTPKFERTQKFDNEVTVSGRK